VRFADGANVSEDMLADFHHQAHDGCFIANSVTTVVTVEPPG
jgi:organic hydroperoxide reductase OsmC/OhrA